LEDDILKGCVITHGGSLINDAIIARRAEG